MIHRHLALGRASFVDDDVLGRLLPAETLRRAGSIVVTGHLDELNARLRRLGFRGAIVPLGASVDADVVLAIEYFTPATLVPATIASLAHVLREGGTIACTLDDSCADAGFGSRDWIDAFHARGFAVRSWNAADDVRDDAERRALDIAFGGDADDDARESARAMLTRLANGQFSYRCFEFIHLC